ncbi:bifunctional adenosylcobinamide kinase/adenosylcobinamide-phosphate guanylyltransferase [Marinomonas mediterranea]|jgi:Adenosyl cobinamide kinase/adenosyl cobinamide phosphate guanylyltransferase|uniref:Bifunctional adenosylcobalamin biosynthesis protein n=1 Tax=Marinomonas mediterranea (strain ATCC 700492 / JCM 21426 / NBRC 103028 / MMB-1) TaxID=717774 RepID=F2JTP9_MARM1|nr:bifunctional adenosylcobinamide kinase/adenosylcobinamide-phosphate guanylyltransferase [Marinomonas mediterranea]ADZ92669.1 Adenosylcobinamide-phosphate guanylyltransferase [Marinomonas mediterranea MMB-1]WCN18701.1 bifunctional adenosylcobinamide kinase/adenosylcobinamide-phosphate guanylyltransferase [Marinomonas mediterranea MMB-1]
MKHLVLGGVRSGKSAYAEQWIEQREGTVSYVATTKIWTDESGNAVDANLLERIELHRQRRPDAWQLVEEPIELAETLLNIARQHRNTSHTILVECCSLWLTNLLCEEPRKDIEKYKTALLNALSSVECDIVLVSSEVGLGIMPMNKLAREFSDELGSLNQNIAQKCDKVTFVAAGLPLTMKG